MQGLGFRMQVAGGHSRPSPLFHLVAGLSRENGNIYGRAYIGTVFFCSLPRTNKSWLRTSLYQAFMSKCLVSLSPFASVVILL